jgi:pimeloyl-ACP methyl ester carboxylesterase
MLDRAAQPLRNLLRAAGRPASYAGELREILSTAVTMGLWPLGLVDRGFADFSRLAEAANSPDGGTTPVLLVHGYGANKSNWLFLERHLRHAGFERVHALNYNPLGADIPALADACTARARDLMDHCDTDRVHLIGHSLGGVVARYAVQVSGLDGVGVCVTVASPHGGVPVARLGRGSTAHQLRPGSRVLRRLAAAGATPSPTRFVAYYSNLDVAVPARRAMITDPALDATNILVKDEGHLSILLSRRLASSVVDQLGSPVEDRTGHPRGIHNVVPLPFHRDDSIGWDAVVNGAAARGLDGG